MSSTIKGAGLLNGYAYPSRAIQIMYENGKTEFELDEVRYERDAMARHTAYELEGQDLIDKLSNLVDKPVFIYSGSKDTRVPLINQK